ncbi:TPA: restriction endonuclease subunit S [Bacillus anthracis]|uniref:restriction endonuclease subunit S n=1 Tax=Bacillus anthracis TaxID=1392 RepID=UPI00030CEED6|nr:restriction endonuclease subunit S [Bacillus cereus]
MEIRYELKKCEDIIDVRDGTHDSPKYVENGYPLVTSKNIKNGKLDLENINYISTEDFQKVNKRSKVDKGDVIMPMIGTIGNPLLVETDREFAIKNVALFKFQDNKFIFNKFFYYFLLSDLCKKQLNGSKRGGTQSFVSLRDLRNLKVPLPPLEQQKEIVMVLDKVQGLIEKRKEAIAKLDELIESVFYDMFGNPITNPKKWETTRLDNIVVLQRGYDLPIKSRNEMGEVEIWGSNGVVGVHNEAKIIGGGIVTGRSGSIGNVYYTYKDFWALNTTLFSKETYGNNIVYLKYLLQYFNLKRFLNGTGVPTLNRNVIHKEQIYKIPLNKQEEFAGIIKQIERTKSQFESSLIRLEESFSALVQRAF